MAFPTPFDVKANVHDGLAVVSVVGELDLATAPRLSHLLAEVAEPGRVVLVDLRHTDFMDSTGIAELATACKHQRELGGDLILDAPNSAVARVIEISGLDRVMTVTSDPERPSPGETR
jgi:anti-sigma B factor antagonist